MSKNLLIKGGLIWSSLGPRRVDIITQGSMIRHVIAPAESPAHFDGEVLIAKGKWVFPGIIDSQVHFREPGLEHKEDLETGSLSALKGGVTTFLEMPNTDPPTVSCLSIRDKIQRAQQKSYVHYGFFIGATRDNLHELVKASDEPGCCGIKIFLGSSTGDLLLYDPQVLEEIFRNTTLPISIHSEDEARLNKRSYIREQATRVHDHERWRDKFVALQSTQMVVKLAMKCQRQIHILHISTAQEIMFLRDYDEWVSCEVTPQHLSLASPDCYDRFGTLAQMNPPIRSQAHQDVLWKGIQDGTVAVIGSDHAPHTYEEKMQGYPKSPSGIPGTQTLFNVMIHHVRQGRLTWQRLVELVCENPARIFRLNKGFVQPGYDADLTIIDPLKKMTIRSEQMASKSNWTPFDGLEVEGSLETVVVGGQVVFDQGQPLNRSVQEEQESVEKKAGPCAISHHSPSVW